MAHRRRRAQEALRERQQEVQLARERRRRKAKRAGIALSVVVAIAVVIAVLAMNAPPQYVQCFQNGTALQENGWFYLRVQNGTYANNSFFRVPVPLGWQGQNIYSMGVYPGCKYPLSIQGQEDYGPEYVKVHIQSPYLHDYTLGDLFYVWDHELKNAPYYLGPDGVQPPGYLRVNGPTVVSLPCSSLKIAWPASTKNMWSSCGWWCCTSSPFQPGAWTLT